MKDKVPGELAMATILTGNYLLPWLLKYYIIKWAGTVLKHGAHHCVIHNMVNFMNTLQNKVKKKNSPSPISTILSQINKFGMYV